MEQMTILLLRGISAGMGISAAISTAPVVEMVLVVKWTVICAGRGYEQPWGARYHYLHRSDYLTLGGGCPTPGVYMSPLNSLPA